MKESAVFSGRLAPDYISYREMCIRGILNTGKYREVNFKSRPEKL